MEKTQSLQLYVIDTEEEYYFPYNGGIVKIVKLKGNLATVEMVDNKKLSFSDDFTEGRRNMEIYLHRLRPYGSPEITLLKPESQNPNVDLWVKRLRKLEL